MRIKSSSSSTIYEFFKQTGEQKVKAAQINGHDHAHTNDDKGVFRGFLP